MKRDFKHNVPSVMLAFVSAFIGLGAMCGFLLIYDPTGKLMMMDNLLPYFGKLPLASVFFTDFTVPGIALVCINGLPNLVATAAVVAAKRWGIVLGGVLGLTLMLWIVIQFVILPFNYLSTGFFFVGLVQALIGYGAYRTLKLSRKC